MGIRITAGPATPNVLTNLFMNHKQRIEVSKKEVKARKTWGKINPVTKVIPSEKKYKRSKEKKQSRKEYYECVG